MESLFCSLISIYWRIMGVSSDIINLPLQKGVWGCAYAHQMISPNKAQVLLSAIFAV